jgi:hypothetical protein
VTLEGDVELSTPTRGNFFFVCCASARWVVAQTISANAERIILVFIRVSVSAIRKPNN